MYDLETTLFSTGIQYVSLCEDRSLFEGGGGCSIRGCRVSLHDLGLMGQINGQGRMILVY
jgi:hypothetical protein